MSLLTTGVTLAAASSLLTLLLLIATVPVIFNELKDAEALFGFEMGLYKSDSNNIWQDLLNEQNWIKPEIIKYMKREANTEEVMQLRNTNFSKKCPYGPPGEPGLPGTDGEPGEEGEPGRPGKAFDSPESDFIREFCPPCPAGRPGPPGYKGKRGPRGMMGQQGPPGRPGNDGLPGVIGEEGNPGYPGEPGMIGAKGLPGDDGIGFAKGLPGPKGEQGLPGMQGERGPPGERGEDAPPGPRGPEGPPGPKGETGQRGIPGETGENGLPGRDGHYCPCPNRSVSTINSKASKEENHLAKKQMTSRERADETLNDVKKETNTSNTVDIGKMNENEMENAAKNSLQEQASMDNSDIENKALNENAEETTDDAEDGDDNEYKDEPEVNDDVQQALARTKLPTTIPSLKKPITDDADAAQLPSEKFEMISDDDNEANEEALADDEKSDDETYAENQEYKSELEVVSNGRRAQNLNGGMQVVSERVDIASEFASNVDDDAKLKAKKRNEGKGEKKVNFIDSTATESNGNKRHHEIVPLEGFVIAPARPTMDTESSENPTRKLHIDNKRRRRKSKAKKNRNTTRQ